MPKIVERMILIVDSLSNYQKRPNITPEMQHMLDEGKKQGNAFLKNFLNKIAKSPPALYKLAFEMRMQDTEDDKYTKLFLGMINPDNLSTLMKEIIFANKKNPQGDGLVWTSYDRYKILCGADFRFVLKYKDGKPYVILEDQEEQRPQTDQWQMDILNKLNDVSSYFNKSYN